MSELWWMSKALIWYLLKFKRLAFYFDNQLSSRELIEWSFQLNDIKFNRFDSSWIIYSIFIFYLSFGAVATLEFTSLYGAPVTHIHLLWSSSPCLVTATSAPSTGTLLAPWLAPYCPIPALACTLLLPSSCGRSSVAIQKHASVTPVLLAAANAILAPPRNPKVTPRVPSILSFYPAIGHHFVPQHHSSLQVHTPTS